MPDNKTEMQKATEQPTTAIQQPKAEQLPKQTLGDITLRSLEEAYSKASMLETTPDEDKILDEPFPESDYSIKPTGEVYLPHIHARKRLTKAFHRKWAIIIIGDPQLDRDKSMVYVKVVLKVKGCYVGYAVGGQKYTGDMNARMTYDDAVEGAISNALNRICGKSALGLGSNAWDHDWAEAWKRKYAYKANDSKWYKRPPQAQQHQQAATAPTNTPPLQTQPPKAASPTAKQWAFLYVQLREQGVKTKEEQQALLDEALGKKHDSATIGDVSNLIDKLKSGKLVVAFKQDGKAYMKTANGEAAPEQPKVDTQTPPPAQPPNEPEEVPPLEPEDVKF